MIFSGATTVKITSSAMRWWNCVCHLYGGLIFNGLDCPLVFKSHACCCHGFSYSFCGTCMIAQEYRSLKQTLLITRGLRKAVDHPQLCQFIRQQMYIDSSYHVPTFFTVSGTVRIYHYPRLLHPTSKTDYIRIWPIYLSSMSATFSSLIKHFPAWTRLIFNRQHVLNKLPDV